MPKALIWIDGGCAPKNPGHAGIGIVIKQKGEKTKILNRYIGVRTNNYAEYTALIVAVKYAKELGFHSVKIHSDSKLIVEQVNGRWKIKSDGCRPLAVEAKDVLTRYYPMAWELTWVPRTQNALADYYCTLALNWGRMQNPWTRKRKSLPVRIIDPLSHDFETSPQ